MERRLVDGNTIVAEVASEFIEVAGVYPITPSTAMAETVEELSHKKKNMFGKEIKVQEMQSEAGAIACCHGALLAGKYASTFTSSQGLLLMIPEMYKIAGEMLPMVMHVAARSLSTHALSIYNDHQDVMAVRQTGFYIICSSSVQECYWNAIKAHIMAIKYNIPVLHFFDGFFTSHRLETIEVLDEVEFRDLILQFISEEDYNMNRDCGVLEFPQTIGTNQKVEYAEYTRDRVNWFNNMKDVYDIISEGIESNGYKNWYSYQWVGIANPKKVVVAMGSVCGTVRELVKQYSTELSLLQINQFRPVSDWVKILASIGDYAEIYVIDKTIEPGAKSPLALDVISELYCQSELIHDVRNKVHILNIGLSSKDISESLLRQELELDSKEDNEPYSIKIHGKGSEGLVTANKWVAKVLFNQGYNVQALSTYSAYKSAGDTWSDLRVSKKEILLQCEVKGASREFTSSDFRPDIAEQCGISGKLSAIAAYTIINQYWAWLGFNYEKAVKDLKQIIRDSFKEEIAEKNIKAIDMIMNEVKEDHNGTI